MQSETVVNRWGDSSPEAEPTNATTNHVDNRKAINESTQMNMDTTAASASTVVENVVQIDVKKGSEDVVVPTNLDDTQNGKPQNENKTSETSMNDLESTSDGKETNVKETCQEEKEDENPNAKSLPQIPVEEEKKFDVSDKRIAKQFQVTLSNKKVNKIFFGTVEKPIPGKDKTYRILYDDGDVDIMSRNDILVAMKYYDKNKKYDTNCLHKVRPWPLTQKSEEEEKSGSNKTNMTASTARKKRTMTKTSPPKRGKTAKAKTPRKEQVPEWTGPPDEHLDGGWPEGVS